MMRWRLIPPSWSWFAALVMACVWVPSGRAHNPDTSYARVHIISNRIELKFTFDIFTLLKITALDENQDQRVDRQELLRAAPSVQTFLRKTILFEINGRTESLGQAAPPLWPTGGQDAIPAPDWHSANGLISFPFSISRTLPRELMLGFDFWDVFGPRHTVLGAFELNGRTEEIVFNPSEPDYLFDIAYAGGFKGPQAPETAPGGDPGATPSPHQESIRGAFVGFFHLGVEHIFLGYDHLGFLLALIVVSRLGELVKIVTSFTVAHSLTLILAATGRMSLPARWVECAIALTIVYVAVENFWIQKKRHRWVLTFAFGLIHGFGFAGVLAGLGLPSAGTMRCLLAFNVGVEAGQLVIVLGLLPFTLALQRWRYGRRAMVAISGLLAVFGLGWFIERLFQFGFMPLN